MGNPKLSFVEALQKAVAVSTLQDLRDDIDSRRVSIDLSECDFDNDSRESAVVGKFKSQPAMFLVSVTSPCRFVHRCFRRHVLCPPFIAVDC
jgi:hypothetical protein